jgi:RNA polymerase subunit RPABC4/transcription elongation factor Spt4
LEELLARALQLFLALTAAYALALWFALIVWTYRDISARSNNVVTHIFSTLIVVLFWVPGAIIYLILRPRETLDENFQRAMEEEYLLQDLDDFAVCPSCRRAVRDEFLFCPHCRAELRHACVSCHRMIDIRWDVCAYCGSTQYETAVEAPEPPAVEPVTRRDRRRAASQLQSIDGGKARERPTMDTEPLTPPRTDDTTPEDEIPAPKPIRTRSGRDQG